MISDMEINSLAKFPSLEPPHKIRRIGQAEFSSLAQAFPASKSLPVTILQRIQATLSLAKDKETMGSYPLYNEVDKNLTIFNLDGCEFLAVNATPTEILKWQNLILP